MNITRKYRLMEKLAKPRWAKEMLNLSPEAQKRIFSILPERGREIKQLGFGAQRVADLMAGRGGFEVRKTPLVKGKGPAHTEHALQEMEKQFQFERDLKRVAEGKGRFGHLRRQEGHIGYYDYVPGKSKGSEIEARHGEAKRKLRAYQKELMHKTRGYQRERTKKEHEHYLKLDKAVLQTRADMAKSRLHELDPATQKVVSKLKELYPRLFDVRAHNIVNRHIVDMSPQPFSAGPPKNLKATGFSPIAHARRNYLRYSGKEGK